eukprot:1152265-Pelagomonas_calceolata.AAC.11
MARAKVLTHARYDLHAHEVITLGGHQLRALSPMARAKVLTHARYDLHTHTHEVITLGGHQLRALSPMAQLPRHQRMPKRQSFLFCSHTFFCAHHTFWVHHTLNKRAPCLSTASAAHTCKPRAWWTASRTSKRWGQHDL